MLTLISSTTNYETAPGITFAVGNSAIFDTRQIDTTSIQNLYNSFKDIRSEVFRPNFFVRAYYAPKQVNLAQRFEETSYYQDKTIVQKVCKIFDNIGIKLFRKLNQEQVILMTKTAGVIEFNKKIDINAVYNFIDSYES